MTTDNKKLASKGLRSRVVNAGAWVMSGYIFSQFIRLASNLILTRLLVPEMFGVMTIVTVITIGLNLFSDIGLLQNVIHSRRGDDPRFLNTVWVIQIIRGFFIFLIMLILSWLVGIAGEQGWFPEGSAYADPVLPGIIAILSLNVLIPGFNSTKFYVANRNLYLKRITIIEVVSQLAGVLFTISWAFIKPEIWALVYGGILASVLKLFFSHAFMPGIKNHFEWDWDAFNEVFHFGKWIFLASVLGFLINQGDQLLLGGLISSKMLGIYSIALYLATAPKMVFGRVFSSVFYPALSEVARDSERKLSDTYYRIRIRVDGITFLVAGLLFISGGSIIELLYDDRYQEAGWMLSVLSLGLISVGPTMLGDQCFLALGHARLISFLNLVQAVALYILLPISFYLYGIYGAIWAITLYPIFKIIVSYWYMQKLNILQASKEIRMLPMLIIGGILGMLLKNIVEWILV